MLLVLVTVHVKTEFIPAFIQATRENAQSSLSENGVARFDIVQSKDDPSQFALFEVYRDADAPARHKQTAHYQRWRDTVAEMMAKPRESQKFETLFPEDERFGVVG